MKKRILLFAPKTFGFYLHIIQALCRNGYEVDFFDEYYSTRFQLLNKFILKLPLKIKIFLQKKYISSILKSEDSRRSKYDYVFVVRGEYFAPSVISILKEHAPLPEYILYQWDSAKNLRFFTEQIGYFDKVFTFDDLDAQYFNVRHKSLFFNSEHVANRSKKESKFSVSFVGTHHSNRFSFIRRFLDANPELMANAVIRLFRPKTSFYRALVFNKKELEGACLSDLITHPVSERKTINILSNSENILDITQPGQVGLTLRTFEALGLQKKLITTNLNVKNYDFYNPNNVFLVDEMNLTVSTDFLQGSYQPVSEDVLNKYYVDFWVQEFFL